MCIRDRLVSSGELICVIVQNFVKIGPAVLEISQFFDFQDGCRPPSWMLEFLNFWFLVRLRGLGCIIIPNFIKIGQKAAEISHVTFCKMAAVRHVGFVGKFWDNPQQEFNGLYHCAKLGCNRISRFDNKKCEYCARLA